MDAVKPMIVKDPTGHEPGLVFEHDGFDIGPHPIYISGEGCGPGEGMPMSHAAAEKLHAWLGHVLNKDDGVSGGWWLVEYRPLPEDHKVAYYFCRENAVKFASEEAMAGRTFYLTRSVIEFRPSVTVKAVR